MISIKTALAPLHDELRQHRLYASISSVDALIIFMGHHVFSVWDFMNLLKTPVKPPQIRTEIRIKQERVFV